MLAEILIHSLCLWPTSIVVWKLALGKPACLYPTCHGWQSLPGFCPLLSSACHCQHGLSCGIAAFDASV